MISRPIFAENYGLLSIYLWSMLAALALSVALLSAGTVLKRRPSDPRKGRASALVALGTAGLIACAVVLIVSVFG